MTATLNDLDLLSTEAVRNPHSVFATLRAAGPVHYLERHRAWVVLDHALIRQGLSDERLSTDTITPMYERLSADERELYQDAERLLRGWMIFNDPPIHAMLRDPVRAAFTPKAVLKLRNEIGALTDDVLDGLGEDAELVSDIAFPLPASVIAVLLGVPPERHQDMRHWSTQLGSLVMGKSGRADKWERALRAAQEMQSYFGGLVAYFREHPGDNLISRMVHAEPGLDGLLTHDQLVGACSLLLFGGHETTTSLLTTAVFHLSQRPDLLARLRAEPELIDSFVEEIVRFDGPSKIVVRRVRETGDWNGFALEAGQAVFLALMSGNRDPSHFANPDEIVVDRNPNRHLGFGWGLHFCLGAQLAHLEAAVVLSKIISRFPNISLDCDVDDLTWHPTIVGRTLRSLPVRLG